MRRKSGCKNPKKKKKTHFFARGGPEGGPRLNLFGRGGGGGEFFFFSPGKRGAPPKRAKKKKKKQKLFAGDRVCANVGLRFNAWRGGKTSATKTRELFQGWGGKGCKTARIVLGPGKFLFFLCHAQRAGGAGGKKKRLKPGRGRPIWGPVQ